MEVICLFYLVAPLLLYLRRPASILACGGTLCLVLFFANRWTHGGVDVRLAQYLPAFVAGILVSQYARRDRLLRSGLALACSLVCLPLLWLGSRSVGDGVLLLLDRQLAALAALPLFFVCAALLVKYVPKRLVYAASYSSFGAYLLHRLVLTGAVALYQPVLWWSSLLYLLCLWVPTAFVAGWVLQWVADRVVPSGSPHHGISGADTKIPAREGREP